MATPLAVTIFWMIVDVIPPARAVATPFPYLIAAVMWLVVLPVYIGLREWFGMRLSRLLAAGVILALPPTAIAYSYFLLPRAHFAASLLIGGGIVGALTFWACLRLWSWHGLQSDREAS